MPTPRWLSSLYRTLGCSPRPVNRPRRRLFVEPLEDRCVPAIAASGAAAGELPIVRTFDDTTLSPISAFLAFDPSYRGGVSVALGDVTGDGRADVIAGTAGGGVPAVVRVFDGASGAEVRSFAALNGLPLGVNVASGDVDGDGRDDIVVSTKEGTPFVRVFSGATGAELSNFFAAGPGGTGGTEVAVGDVDGDGKADVVTAIRGSLGTAVRTFNGMTGGEISSFLASPTNGPVSLAIGDVDGDGRAEVLLGLADGPAVAALFDGLSGTVKGVYVPFGMQFSGGLRVGIGPDTNGDGIADLIFGANGTPLVGTVNATNGGLLQTGVLSVTNVGNLSNPNERLRNPGNNAPPAPAANAAPTVTLPASFTGNENSPLALTGISVADPDAGTGLVRVSLGVANGTLTLGTDGLTFTTGDGTGDEAVTFTGTLGAVNAALAGLTYTPDLNYLGGDTLTVAIDDQGNTGAGGAKTATATSAITVNNVNDAPAITSNGGGATAGASLSENTTAVTTVTATDADAGSTLTYSIVGGADAARFGIDAGTGALTFLSAPDFENPTDTGTNNVYDVTVRVSDGALFDDQAIAVTVNDLNDNAPVITSNGGGATAGTSASEGQTAVTTVTATDADAGSTLTYSIIGGADSALFGIDSSTGVLTFLSAPSFAAPTDSGGNNVYDVTVQVSDGTFTDSQAIAVTVTNVNENASAPVITSNGGGATASTSASENTTAVTTVTATDADAGSTLTYSIVGGADSELFGIDAGTGVLTFLSAPDFESPADAGGNNVYDVTVQVSDGTNTDTQTIAVTVNDLNDNAPAITSNGGGATAGTSASEGQTAVTTVTATDADAGSTLTYSIVGGADAARFGIDAGTGVLTFLSAPDFESPADAGGNNVYDVTIRVSDGALFDDQAVAVTVNDVNENASAPVITSNGGGATASTSASEGQTAVTTVTATDADAGSTLTYSIIGGADSALFGIDSSTGVLTFLSAPSFAAPTDSGGNNVYDVTVQVSDGTFTDSQAIAVTVNELNLAPVVTTSTGTTSYTVGNPGAVIDGAITVTDANAGDMVVGATVEDVSGFAPGDVLDFNSALATGFGISGSYDGTTTGTLTFTGTATTAQYQAVLRTVTFATSIDASVTLTFAFNVNDGDTTGSGNKDVAVTSTT